MNSLPVESQTSSEPHTIDLGNPHQIAALEYAARGFLVFPLLPHSKKPATAHGLKDATNDADIIRHWWNNNPCYNIGLLTGPESGIYVVDVDSGVTLEGVVKVGEQTLADLIAQHGPLPDTLTQRTGRGGRQFFFRYPQDGQDWPNTTGVIGKDIDTRGRGGYAVVPPSVHPETGSAYQWLTDLDQPLAEVPTWLLQLSRKRTPTNRVALSVAASEGTVAEGSRNSTLASIAGSMRRRGMGQEAICAALLIHNRENCQPPLPEAEVETIAVSISRYEVPASKELPKIIIGTDEHRVAAEVLAALAELAQRSNVMFCRSGFLTHIVQS